MSLVGLVKIRNENFKEALAHSLRLVNYEFPRDAKNIVIKPNMCYYWDASTGQTTDPRFIGALIEIIRDKTSKNANISLVESDASAMKCRYAFKFLGYEKLPKKYGVGLVNLSEDDADSVDLKIGRQVFHLKVPRILRDADLKINVTKIKYSLDKIKITSVLKNIYGCNPYPTKFKYHRKLDETIVALNKAIRFNLCLIDAHTVAGKSVSRLGLVMAGTDPVAMDTAAAKIAGVNPHDIRYIRLAHEEGLGGPTFLMKGLPIEYFVDRFPRKDAKKKLLSKAYSLVTLLKLGRKLGLE